MLHCQLLVTLATQVGVILEETYTPRYLPPFPETSSANEHLPLTLQVFRSFGWTKQQARLQNDILTLPLPCLLSRFPNAVIATIWYVHLHVDTRRLEPFVCKLLNYLLDYVYEHVETAHFFAIPQESDDAACFAHAITCIANLHIPCRAFTHLSRVLFTTEVCDFPE